jgi:hypothetical protein
LPSRRSGRKLAASGTNNIGRKIAMLHDLLRRTLSLCLLMVAALAAGCASGPAFEPVAAVPGDKALLYFYRPASHGALYKPMVSVNDKGIVALQAKGYFPYLVTPGKLRLSISNIGTVATNFDAAPGQTYYIRAGTVFMGVGVPFIEAVPAQTGAQEIRDCKLLPAATSM